MAINVRRSLGFVKVFVLPVSASEGPVLEAGGTEGTSTRNHYGAEITKESGFEP